jgi:hypothetical protein
MMRRETKVVSSMELFLKAQGFELKADSDPEKPVRCVIDGGRWREALRTCEGYFVSDNRLA